MKNLDKTKSSGKLPALFKLLLIIPVSWLVFELALLIHPFPDSRLEAGYPESIRLFDRQGTLLREVVTLSGAKARWVEWDDISPFVKKAIIAVEDERFLLHNGVDIISLGRAVLQNISAVKTVSGASTLTMQLARLLYGHSHTIGGKILQTFDALRIERAVNKEKILLNYLNRASFGGSTMGIETAARRFFGKPGLHLSLAESALLAGLPNGPTKFNPLRFPEKAKMRQHYVLERMLETKVITPGEYNTALKEPLLYVKEERKFTAMHFTDYILTLNPPPGNVITTLDYNLNRQIEELMKDHVSALAAGGMTNAAAVVLDNETGNILAMAGSVDYWDGKNGAVNGATALRQPGSALKPFTYTLAFDKGFTPAHIAGDIKTVYTNPDGTLYVPKNYSKEYNGPVLLAEALGRSLNIPAVRLANAVGLDLFLNKLKDSGFSSLNRDYEYYGLGLTLGSGEVTLLELAQGYALLARQGLTIKAKGLPGKIQPDEKRVFSKEACFMTTSILTNEEYRIRAFGITNPLLLGFPMAIKTGTSSNWRDNWIAGYTKEITIAVWAGDFSGSPMNQMSGAIGAGPLFNKIARLVTETLSITPTQETPPDTVKMITVCKKSGKTPNPYCPEFSSHYVIEAERSRLLCDVHRTVTIDRRNGLLASEKCPSDFKLKRVFEFLPPVYAEWQSEHGGNPPPKKYSPLCSPEDAVPDALVIIRPSESDIYVIEPGYNRQTQTLEFSGEVNPPVEKVEWILNEKIFATVSWPYKTVWPLQEGRHTLFMRSGNRTSEVIHFEVR